MRRLFLIFTLMFASADLLRAATINVYSSGDYSAYPGSTSITVTGSSIGSIPDPATYGLQGVYWFDYSDYDGPDDGDSSLEYITVTAKSATVTIAGTASVILTATRLQPKQHSHRYMNAIQFTTGQATITPTGTPTNTPTFTNTPTNTPTNTVIASATKTQTCAPSWTPACGNQYTATPTNTATYTATNTPTNTGTNTATNTTTNTPTKTGTATNTTTRTATNTPPGTRTWTPTFTPSSTRTNTPNPSITSTPQLNTHYVMSDSSGNLYSTVETPGAKSSTVADGTGVKYQDNNFSTHGWFYRNAYGWGVGTTDVAGAIEYWLDPNDLRLNHSLAEFLTCPEIGFGNPGADPAAFWIFSGESNYYGGAPSWKGPNFYGIIYGHPLIDYGGSESGGATVTSGSFAYQANPTSTPTVVISSAKATTIILWAGATPGPVTEIRWGGVAQSDNATPVQ